MDQDLFAPCSSEEQHKLPALYGLPSKIAYCKRCVISNQRPSSVVEFKATSESRKATIGFDDEGICSACRFHDRKANEIDWHDREQQLIKLCDQYRSKKGYYDCLVPGSGGKDSVFVAHQLKYKYGMNPLTVTWAPHRYTEVGWKNMESWIHSGFDNVLFHPNGKFHRLITRLAFENLCHPFQPFIIGQKMIASKMSELYRIPLIFYGENSAEYGVSNKGDKKELNKNDSPVMDPKFYSASEFDIRDVYLGGVKVESLIKDYGVSINDLNPYIPANASVLEGLGSVVHHFGYYVKWDPQACYYYAAEHCGFQANSERTEGSYSKYSSIDDRLDMLHYYTTFIKFGFGRCTLDAAQEVRNNKIDREEAVALVRRYDSEFPAKYYKEMLEYMGVTDERFREVIDKARSPHLWMKKDGAWALRCPVWEYPV